MATPSKPSSFLKFGGEGCSTEPRPSCTPDVCSLFPVTLRAMELSSFAVWPSLLHARAVILLLFLLLVHSLSFCMCSVPPPGFIASPTNSPSSSPGRADDRLALLSFKSAISDDPLGATASWNESTPVCQWPGVTCGRQPPGRVTELVLDGHQLVGTMSPGLGNLTFLTKLHLPSNRLHGDIPWELGRLSRLQSLILSFNSLNGEIPSSLASCFGLQRLSLKANKLQGKIPANLSSCSELQVISFGENELAGKIPPELGSLSKLFYLNLSSNNLTGVIPPSLGNLSSLRFLYLSDNSLQEIIPPEFGSLSELEDLFLDRNKLTGEIPPQLGNLSNLYTLSLYENNLDGSIPTELGGMRSLETFDVYVNRLSGEIPLSLYNLSSLLTLQVGDNNLSGILPQDLGNTLPNLIFLHLFKNRFEGPIPSSLSNATRLEKIELSDNRFTGLIPSHLGALRHLRRLILGNNSLEAWEAKDWSFITSLANCRNLTELELYDNRLGGVLPTSIVNLSTQLTSLKLEGNQISGSIPAEIEKLVNLTKLHMSKNLLTGPIPATIGKLQNLQSLELGGNKFSGGIPSSLGKLSRLIKLSLGGNELEGTIPMDLGNCRNLQSLNLSSNRLNGIIPREVLSLSLLSSHLDLSRNNLTGSLPAEVGNLKNLNRLDVSENKLAGEIPVAIGQCAVLEYLHMEGNIFEGTIPQALCNLKGLQELDLSFNRLSGRIPVFLENLSLLHLNLSFNDFEGEVPHKGIFQNVSAVSLLGNTKLCGGGPEFHFQVCPMNDAKRRKFSSKLKIIVPVVGIVLLVVLLSSFIIYYLRKNSQNSLSPSELLRKHLTEISYAELHRSTDGFSSSNLIGMGSYGTVYRGKLGKDGEYVAVKVLNLKQLGASRSFITECDALKNVRHRNLVKIVTSCSGVDFEGHEFKALVYDLMPNGSLEEWLHPEVSELPKLKNLSFVQRLGVAIDVASAIDYLHQYVHISIIHSDLKPSNVLLDDRMTAHVGDFGLAMFLSSESSHYATCSVGLKGTIGYVAPEFGMVGKVSTSIDVYSYGILLLEMFTGKRPTDDIFKDGLTLHKFVGEALPDQVMDILDLKLLSEEKDTEPIYDAQMTEKMLECLVSVFKLGLLCSKESHWERPKMGDISKALILTRDTFLGAECLRDKLSC